MRLPAAVILLRLGFRRNFQSVSSSLRLEFNEFTAALNLAEIRIPKKFSVCSSEQSPGPGAGASSLSLKQQSVGRHVAPLRYIILIPSQLNRGILLITFHIPVI